jgi:hypothetical protein
MKRDQKEKRIGRAIRDINKGERGGAEGEKRVDKVTREHDISRTTRQQSAGLAVLTTFSHHLTSLLHTYTPLTFRS